MAQATLKDDRSARRNQASIVAGSALGAGVGLVIGALIPGGPTAALLATLVVSAAGAFLGRLIGGHLAVDDWDPGGGRRPYVGAHAPDADTTES
jgi:uncharacterized protein YcfJ